MGAFSKMTQGERVKSCAFPTTYEYIDCEGELILFEDGCPILPEDSEDDNEEWSRVANERLFLRNLLNGRH